MNEIINFMSRFIFFKLSDFYTYAFAVLFCIIFIVFLCKDKKNLNILFLIPLITSLYAGINYAFRFSNVHKTALLYWDIKGLHCANLALDSGLSPYNGMADCMFPNLPMLIAYQPIFLNFFWNISYLTFEIIWLITTISFIYIIYFCSKRILDFKSNILFFVIFLLGAYQGASWVTFQSGNIAIITYGLSVLFLYRLIVKEKQLGFFILIGILTAFKYHFILLLLYPVFIKKRIDIKYHVLSFLVFISITALSFYFYSHLYSELINDVISVQLDQGLKPYPSELPIYQYFEPILSGLKFNTIFKGLIFLILFFFLYREIKNNKELTTSDIFIIATFMIMIGLPRLKLYDLLLIIPCTLKFLENCYFQSFNKFSSKSIFLIIASSFFFHKPAWWWSNHAFYYIILLFILFLVQKATFLRRFSN